MQDTEIIKDNDPPALVEPSIITSSKGKNSKWKCVYLNLATLAYNHLLKNPDFQDKNKNLLIKIIFLWKGLSSDYFTEGNSSIKKLERLVAYLTKSSALEDRLHHIIKKKIFSGEELVEFSTPFEDAEVIGASAAPMLPEEVISVISLLGIFQVVESLVELREGIENLVDDGKLLRLIEKLVKKVPVSESNKELISNLNRMKNRLFSDKLKRQTFGLVARSTGTITAGTTETVSGILTLAGSAGATTVGVVSSSAFIAAGGIQTGCSLRNIWKGIKTYYKIKKFKKAANPDPLVHNNTNLLLTDFIAEEKFKAVRKISSNVANGIGGTGAVVIGITGIVLLFVGPVSLGVTIPLGVATIGVSLAGLAAKYGTIYLLDRKHEKKLKLNPQLTAPALSLRLLQLLDQQFFSLENYEAVNMFLEYFKDKLNKESSRRYKVLELQELLTIELAILARKQFTLFKEAWKSIVEENQNLLLTPDITEVEEEWSNDENDRNELVENKKEEVSKGEAEKGDNNAGPFIAPAKGLEPKSLAPASGPVGTSLTGTIDQSTEKEVPNPSTETLTPLL